MENDVFVIFHKTATDFGAGPIVVVRNLPQGPSPLPTSILDWYAEVYGFERKSLSGCWLKTIDGKECPIVPKRPADATYSRTDALIYLHVCSPRGAEWISRNSTTNVADTISYAIDRGEQIISQMQEDGLTVEVEH
jgi:hypothetical protein